LSASFGSCQRFETAMPPEDIDCIIDPNIEKLQKAILAVALKQNIGQEWINARMELFAACQTNVQLFQESIEQPVVLWRGNNLAIYAIKWEWSLARHESQ
jgi:hypothetical protein